MSAQPNAFKARLAAWREQVLSQWQRLRNALSRANSQELDLESIKTWFSETAERLEQRFQELKSQERRLTWSDIRSWLHLHGRQLALYLILPIGGLLLLMLIQHQTRQQVSAMYLHQAQVTAIESMIQKSRLTSLNGDPSPLLNDNEVETIRIMLQNRGIAPNILRLNIGRNGGSILELQAEQVVFGQWISFLEETALRWDLFPVDLTIKAEDAPEIVSIRAVLQQSTEGN